jgi:hypothetical protein
LKALELKLGEIIEEYKAFSLPNFLRRMCFAKDMGF